MYQLSHGLRTGFGGLVVRFFLHSREIVGSILSWVIIKTAKTKEACVPSSLVLSTIRMREKT